MNMDAQINVSALSRNYWIAPDLATKSLKSKDKDFDKKIANLVALITTCVTESFPELSECSEGRFVRFQEKLKALVISELKEN